MPVLRAGRVCGAMTAARLHRLMACGATGRGVSLGHRVIASSIPAALSKERERHPRRTKRALSADERG
jgi:hypothetical protein